MKPAHPYPPKQHLFQGFSGSDLRQDACERFASLFAGATDRQGRGHGEDVKRGAGLEDFAAHLAGEGSGLGIYPLLDGQHCGFCTVDVDRQDFELAQRIAMELPGVSWVARSRSKGFHVIHFFAVPAAARVARAIMADAIHRVIRNPIEAAKIERFPKQEYDAERWAEGKRGNYINLPMHGDQRPVLWKVGDPMEVDPAGGGYELSSFVAAAEEHRDDPRHWEWRAERRRLLEPERGASSGEFGERNSLHICAQHVYDNRFANPVTEGHRDTVYFALAKQYANCRHYNREETIEMLFAINEASPDPFPEGQIVQRVDRAYDGEYTSTGCDDPLFAPWKAPGCSI